MSSLPYTSIVRSLPFSVPFLAPEAIERLMGRRMVLRLGANESNFGISPHAAEAMAKALEHIGWYGDPESYELREHLALKLGISREDIVVGAGADDLLALIARTFLEPGDHAVNSLGGYPTFNYAVLGVGGQLDLVPYRDDQVDLEGLVARARETGAKLVYLSNPDNPSGSWQSTHGLQQVIELLPPGCLLVLDEAYSDFAGPDALPPIDPTDTRIIRVRTFSKAHGMAGARVGYAIAGTEIIGSFNKIRLHFSVNSVAQAGALASLRDEKFVQDVVEQVRDGRAEYKMFGQELGVSTLPSATNFVEFDLGSFELAKATMEALLQRGVFVRMPSAAPLNRCVRVTVGLPHERALFGKIFSEVVNGLRPAFSV